MTFEMLICGKSCSTFSMTIFSFTLGIPALKRFTGLAFKSKYSKVLLPIIWYLESTAESFGFFVYGLNVSF